MTRQFDVFVNPVRTGREDRPYVITLQHDHLDQLRARLVAPLVKEKIITPGARLTPQLPVRGQTLYLLPTEIITLSKTYLRDPVANLEEFRRQIIDAIDLMLVGF
jgi:hypothetical protein